MTCLQILNALDFVEFVHVMLLQFQPQQKGGLKRKDFISHKKVSTKNAKNIIRKFVSAKEKSL